MRILGLVGSLGAKSSNRFLLEAVRDMMPRGVDLAVRDGIGDLPYFNPDLDREGAELPAVVARFRREIGAADAILISTPEYAHGIPGVLKNALDWLVSGPEMVGKPVGIVLGSAGDAEFAREALSEVLVTMSARVVPGAVLGVRGVRSKLDQEGKIKDPELVSRLRAAVAALIAEIGSRE